MQELIEGCVAVRLLASGKEFIAAGRREERKGNWKGAACCYVNAARQLGHLPGQTERRAKALGRAGLCFSRNEDLELAMACYQDAWLLCRELGEIVAAEYLSRKMAAITRKQFSRRVNHVYMRDVQEKAGGQAAVGMQSRADEGGRCAVGELRQDSGAAEMVGDQVCADGADQGCGHGLCGTADVQPPLPPLRGWMAVK